MSTSPRVSPRFVLFLALAAAALAFLPADATTYCVGDEVELAAALADAASNGVDDVVRLRVGTYDVPNGGLHFVTNEGRSLTLIGGHVSLFGGCPRVFADDPSLTVLNLPSSSWGIDIDDNSPAMEVTPVYRVEGLTFDDGYGGVHYENSPVAEGVAVELVGNIFRRTRFYPFWVAVHGDLRLWNNLVVDNGTLFDPLANGGVIYVKSGGAAYVTHNTFARNTVDADSAALFVLCTSDSSLDVFNNVLVQSYGAGADLYLHDDCDSAVAFNTVTEIDGDPAVACCNATADPLFVDAVAGDYRLSYPSPARNVGSLAPAGGMPSSDLVDNPRIAGVLPDFGAYEVPWVFAGDFESGTLSGWSAP